MNEQKDKSLKELIYDNKVILIIFVAAAIILPCIVHILYKIESPFQWLVHVWDAGDILSYIGTLLGIMFAVYGVYVTIQYTQKNYHADILREVLPYLAITVLRNRSLKNILNVAFGMFNSDSTNDNEDTKPVYEEYRITKVVFSVEDKSIEISTALNKHQRHVLENGGIIMQRTHPNEISAVSAQLLYLPIHIENVGKGTAVNLYVGLYRKESKPLYMATPLLLKANDSIGVHIYVENANEQKAGDYLLEFSFLDVYSTAYHQVFPIHIGKQGNDYYISVEPVARPERVKR